METMRLEYRITALRHAFGVSRSGFYAWLNGKRSPRAQAEAQIQGHDEPEPQPARRQQSAEPDVRAHSAERSLGDRHHPAHADEGWLYVAGVKDVFTCELAGHAMGARITQGLTAQALWCAARNKRPGPDLIHHSDRCNQHCANNYRKLAEQCGMRASMSRKGNCYGNAPMESFWGSLKNELVHHQRYATRADAQAAIQKYIENFYNRQRRHSRLGNVPPALLAENFSKQPRTA